MFYKLRNFSAKSVSENHWLQYNVYGGLLEDWTRFNLPVGVKTRISLTRLAKKTGTLSRESSHRRTVLLSIHLKNLSICVVKARWISALKCYVSTTVCHSSNGIVNAFREAEIGFLKTKGPCGTIVWSVKIFFGIKWLHWIQFGTVNIHVYMCNTALQTLRSKKVPQNDSTQSTAGHSLQAFRSQIFFNSKRAFFE